MLLQRFVGNINSEAVVQNKLSHPVRTRFLRFVPLDWNPSGWMGLRVEVYGCSYSELTRHAPQSAPPAHQTYDAAPPRRVFFLLTGASSIRGRTHLIGSNEDYFLLLFFSFFFWHTLSRQAAVRKGIRNTRAAKV